MMKNYNVTVIYANGTALNAMNVKAVNKNEIFNKYSKDSVYGNTEEIVSITIVEKKLHYELAKQLMEEMPNE